jgi:hypothetical protein
MGLVGSSVASRALSHAGRRGRVGVGGSALPLHVASVAVAADENAYRLSPPEQEKPPPRREVVRVPVDDEGREILAG